MRKVLIMLFALMIVMPLFVNAQTGNHYGEQKHLTYEIEYLDPLGITRVSEEGIEFLLGGYQLFDFLDTILPEQYFGDYPLYFANDIMSFRVIMRNEGQRTFRNLRVETFQEFLNINGGQGEPIGDDNRHFWFIEKLGPGEEIVLEGEFAIPLLSESGIDQTHLRILHWSPKHKEENFEGQFSKGQIILEDFQAGLWCPSVNL